MTATSSLVIFLAALVPFVLLCAKWDHKRIKKHKRIYHVLMWCFRAAAVGGVATLIVHYTGDWNSLPFLLILGAFLFSLVFRLRLNALRGCPWYYLGKGAIYDRFFLWIAVEPTEPKDGTDADAWGRYGSALNRYWHRAGYISSITETLLSLLAGSGYLITNTF